MKAMDVAINHILTTQRNCFEFHFGFILGKQLIINRHKFDWETLNTPKIKTVFYSYWQTDNDYGTKLRIKCQQRIQRKEKTIDGELCANWDRIDSFGVELDFKGSIHHTHGYKKFYYDPIFGYWYWSGDGL